MEKSAEEYIVEHWVKNKIWTHLDAPKHQERLKKCAELCRGERFADVGCACGHSTDIMRKYVPGDWTGVDFSATAIERAPGFFDDIEFKLIESFDALSELKDLNLDSIVCSEVLEHVVEDRQLVEGLWSVVSERVIFTTPSVRVNDPGHIRLYDEDMLAALFEGIPHTVENTGLFWYVVCDKKDEPPKECAPDPDTPEAQDSTVPSGEIVDSREIVIDGQKMFIDLRDTIISSRLGKGKVYDLPLRAIIRKHLKPGMVAIDVGAHIGWQTVLMSRVMKNNGAVWAIEPSPRNAQFLKANVDINRRKNVKIIDMAAWDEEKEVALYLSPNNTGDHNLIADSSREKVSIKTMKLDTLGSANFIKIDAQGSEMAILRGARKLIENSPGLLMVVEYWPQGLSAFGNPLEVIDELRKNFELSVVGSKLTVDEALLIVSIENRRFFNIACRKKV